VAELPSSYLLGIAEQLISVSALLGGFAATYLGTLLFSCPRSRTGGLTIGLTAVSACGFIVSVLALAALTIQLRPDAPAAYATATRLLGGRILGIAGFVLGIYALLVAIGLSGWLRSRRLGLATTIAAGVATALSTWVMVS